MMIKVSIVNFEQLITVQFRKFERLALDKKFKSLGFQIAETTNPFNVNARTPMKYWRETNDVFLQQFTSEVEELTHATYGCLVNSIDKPLIYTPFINIALFRIAEETYSFRSATLLTATQIKDYAQKIKVALVHLFDYEQEITIEATIKVKTTQTEEVI